MEQKFIHFLNELESGQKLKTFVCLQNISADEIFKFPRLHRLVTVQDG